MSGFAAQHQALLLSTAVWSLLLSSPLGLSTLLALACDLLALATCHVSLLYWLFAAAYSAQLRALAALWRLFRGRKRNPLRRRVDSSECHVEQIVVGPLAFTPLLLLLPTTWAYYALFLAAYSGFALPRAALQIGGAAVCSFPSYRLAAWAAGPGAFPSDVSFQVTSAERKAGEDRPDRGSDWEGETSGKVWKRGAKVKANGGGSVDGLRVRSAGRSPGTGSRTADETFESGRLEMRTEEGGVTRIRPQAKEVNVGGEERIYPTGRNGQGRWDSDRRLAMELDDMDSGRFLHPAGRQAGAKLAGASSPEEWAARHLRLELVTADAVDVL